MSWTTTNEARYQQLQDELHDLTKARERSIEEVKRVFKQALNIDDLSLTEFKIDWFRVVAHADSLRDALAPYDSGVRPKSPPMLDPSTPPWAKA